MTLARTFTVTPIVTLLAALGATAALGSSGAQERPASRPATTVFAVVQSSPDGSVEPAQARVAQARAHALAPHAAVRVVPVAGTLEAQAAVARAAATADVVVGAGASVRPALAAARSSWPDLRVSQAG